MVLNLRRTLLFIGLFPLMILAYVFILPKFSNVKADLFIGEFCSGNTGTIWQVQYKFKWGSGTSGYIPGGIYVQNPVPQNVFGICQGPARQYYTNFPNYPAPNDPPFSMFWWTQCHDPEESPLYTALGFTAFSIDVTKPGGDNLSPGGIPVPANDPSGSSCPIRSQPPPSPPPYVRPTGLSASPTCYAVPIVTFSWNVGNQSELWLDVSTDPNFGGGFNSTSLDHTRVGTNSSFQWSYASKLDNGMYPSNSSRYYWRLWDPVGGHTFPTPSSVVTQNCGGVTLNNPNPYCSGTSAIIDFSWSSTTGSSQYRMWRDGSYFATANGTSWRYNAPSSDQGQSHQWYVDDPVNGIGSSAKLVTTPTCTSPSPPTISNLQAIPSCNGPNNTPRVVFSWSPPSSNLWIDVSTDNPILFNFGNKDVSGRTSFSWDSSNQLNNSFQSPQEGTRYYWRLYDQTQDKHFSGQSFTTPNNCQPTLTCSPSTYTAQINESVRLTAGGGTGSYTWQANGGNLSSTTGQSVNVSYSSDGSYTVAVYSGSGPPATCNITVNPQQPPPPITSSPTPITTPTPFSPPPTDCPNPTGAIDGFKKIEGGDTDFMPPDYPGARVTIWGNGINQTFYEDDNPYYLSGIPASSAGLIYSVSASGVSGWRVKAVVNGDGGANGVHPWSQYGQGTSVNVSVTCGADVAVWFFFQPASVTPTPVATPTSTPTPPPVGISLSATSNCVNGSAIVHLRWTSTTGDSQYSIYLGPQWMITLGDVRSWDSGVQPQNVNQTWSVMGLPSGEIDYATVRTATCGVASPPVGGCPIDINEAGLNVEHANGSRVTPANPANPGETLNAILGFDSQGTCDARNFRGYFWINLQNPPAQCPPTPAGSDFFIGGLSTNGNNVYVSTSRTFTAPATFGTYRAQMYLDGNCAIGETDETNNTDQYRYIVGTPASPVPTPAPGAVDVSIVPKGNQTVFNVGDSANFTFTVTNNSSSATNNILVGFWPRGAPPALPNCPSSGASAPQLPQTISLGANASSDVSFGFNVGSTPGTFTAVAYAGANCAIAEAVNTWGNNAANQSYSVGATAWFETTRGDVGAVGNIKNGPHPAQPNRFQSDWALAAISLSADTIPRRWRIAPYDKPLVPLGSVYSYFATRFKEEAKANPNCNVSSGTQNLNYCGHSLNLGGGPLSGVHAVWFIDGDLNVGGNLTLDNASTAVFVVRGNITVDASVTRADGVYIAGGTFYDADGTNPAGGQLVIQGAVYANDVNLPRLLGGLCGGGSACDNAQTPALVINFEPKYLIAVSDLLGSHGISWKEIEP